jgi:hypothetical protein
MNLADHYNSIMLALAVWREARGEPRLAKLAVAHVILNRMADRRWPDTAVEVVTQPRQFSAFNANDPNATKFPTPKQTADWAAWLEGCDVVGSLNEGPSGPDPTSGANHYESIADVALMPGWALPERITCRAGKLRFYRL